MPVARSQSIEVQLFGRYRDTLEGSSLTIDLPAGATVGDLIARLHSRYPGCLPSRPSVAVNMKLATDSVVVAASDQVALIPAVAGG